MGLRNFLTKTPAQRLPADERAARIPTADLPSWAEQCAFEVGRGLQHYARTGETVALDEVIYAAEGIIALAGEMKRRHL